MPKRKSDEEKLADLEAQEAAVKEKKKRVQAKMRKQARKDADHERFIIGGTMLELAKEDVDFAAKLSALLDQGVTRQDHREFLVERGTLKANDAMPAEQFPRAAE